MRVRIPREEAVSELCGLAEMLGRLPTDCVWYRLAWGDLDPSTLRHVYSEDWAAISQGTGRVDVTAQSIRDGSATDPVVERIRETADRFDPALCTALLLGANDAETGPYVIIDGNHRATAIVLRGLWGEPVAAADLPIFMAVSGSQPIWNWDR